MFAEFVIRNLSKILANFVTGEPYLQYQWACLSPIRFHPQLATPSRLDTPRRRTYSSPLLVAWYYLETCYWHGRYADMGRKHFPFSQAPFLTTCHLGAVSTGTEIATISSCQVFINVCLL